ncbi:hypothetical protein IJG78_00250 [Candidatus Saccharibacteria bacterium]|nr:hypothetical protein [Candidatus Saccharibacteria bacterium]
MSKKNENSKKQVSAEKTSKKTEEKKTDLRKRKTFNIVLAIISIVVVLAGVGVGIWALVRTFSMDEIPTEDETAQELLYSYFYGNHGCSDAKNDVFRKESLDISKLDSLTKERMVIGFMAYYKYSGMTYDQINEVYHRYFGSNDNIREKDSYTAQEGTYHRTEDGIYSLDANCDPPELATCVIIDRAYKNKDGDALKLVLRVYTIDENTGKVYAGIDPTVDDLGDNALATIDDINLPKWEVEFKKDKDLDLLVIEKTKRLN